MTDTPVTWPDARMLALDFETTGTDPETARIVTGALVTVGGGLPTETETWLIDPGVEIPEEATALHGITTERARSEGTDPKAAITEITTMVEAHVSAGLPLVVFNARYDLTVLDRETARHDVPAAALAAGRDLQVIDPFVLDKQVARYRRGRRTLTALCEHYRVRHDGAHESANDALAAARLAWRLPRVHPELAATPLDKLHGLQTGWAAEQAASLQDYLRRTDPDATVDGHWPLIPAQRT